MLLHSYIESSRPLSDNPSPLVRLDFDGRTLLVEKFLSGLLCPEVGLDLYRRRLFRAQPHLREHRRRHLARLRAGPNLLRHFGILPLALLLATALDHDLPVGLLF